MEILFKPQNEILGMNGPWTAIVEVNNKELNGVFIDQKPVFDYSNRYLFLVKPIKYKKWFIEKIAFAIHVLDFLTEKEYQSKEHFQYLYIDNYIDNNVLYYLSFHEEPIEKRRSLVFDDSSFNIFQ